MEIKLRQIVKKRFNRTKLRKENLAKLKKGIMNRHNVKRQMGNEAKQSKSHSEELIEKAKQYQGRKKKP